MPCSLADSTDYLSVNQHFSGFVFYVSYPSIYPSNYLFICLSICLCSWASFIPLTPSKRTYHLHFLAYWGFKSRKGTILKEGILDSQNNTNSLIGVQGDSPCILFSSFSKLFLSGGNMF